MGDMEEGANTPTKAVEGSDVKIPKTFEEYSKEEAAAAECNDKALNALFGAVDSSQYRLIANCTEAKKAWKILETTHEGDERVKTAKYQILMTRFENLRMEDKESVTEFHGRVRDLANEAERLGRSFEEDNLVLKVLRALPESYSVDAKAIRQAHDLKRMTLDQLMGNLETIELAMSEEQKKKKAEKQTAFQVGDLDLEDEVISDDDFQEQLSLVTKQFIKRWLQRKGKQAFIQDPQRGSQSRVMKEKEFKTQPSETRRKGPQCFECGGFRHIQTECANNIKKTDSHHGAQQDCPATEIQSNKHFKNSALMVQEILPSTQETSRNRRKEGDGGETKPSPDEPAQEDEEFIRILDEEPLVAVSEVPFHKESEVKKSKKKGYLTQHSSAVFCSLRDSAKRKRRSKNQKNHHFRWTAGTWRENIIMTWRLLSIHCKGQKATLLGEISGAETDAGQSGVSQVFTAEINLETEKGHLVTLLRQAREATPDEEHTNSGERRQLGALMVMKSMMSLRGSEGDDSN
ncbi:unnamed protein product [Cuscuta campestris]|uniref:CCHC-type domain-containing protein n=1 Tax=Cuscuta campestris TaxID=132261 RepID=A0A484N7D7_9ASTE|nr:unnamed protein product [Cuscuta campestris]